LEFEEIANRYVERLRGIMTDEPILYRSENGGDYDSRGVLRDDVAAKVNGFDAHLSPGGGPAS
jgi:NAD(P)H dehydrogenase (quinone)